MNKLKKETKKKVNEKFTKNEIATLFISVFALLISLGQLFFNSPFFTDKISKPKLIMFEILNDNVSIFTIVNDGNKNANNVKINLTCWIDDTIIISDKTSINPIINRDALNSDIQSVSIQIDKIIPNQEIIVVVQNEQNSDSIRNTYQNLKLPLLSSVHSDEGYGIRKVEK